MDLNENLLINNRQVWARFRFLFLRYMSLSLSFRLLLSSNSSCFESRTRMEGRRDGAKQAPNMKMDVVRGAAVTWQAFHQTSSCTSWQTENSLAATPHLTSKEKTVKCVWTFLVRFFGNADGRCKLRKKKELLFLGVASLCLELNTFFHLSFFFTDKFYIKSAIKMLLIFKFMTASHLI